MTLLYLAPQWFRGFDIFLELVFAFVTLFVAIYSFRIYRVSSLRECELFGIAFSFISASYFIWPFLNFFFISEITSSSVGCFLPAFFAIATFGFYAHFFFFLIGISTLAYLTFNTTGYRKYSLFVSLPLLAVIFAEKVALVYYFVSAVLVFYLVLHYAHEYSRNKKQTTAIILTAFSLLFLAKVGFVFASLYHLSYVLGHFLELGAYALILFSLVKLMRK